MTRDEIIRMARESGFAINTRTGDINASHGSYNWIINRELERFAALVEAAEREAFLAECKFGRTSADIEIAIRARGKE